jgi:hypothetical protein
VHTIVRRAPFDQKPILAQVTPDKTNIVNMRKYCCDADLLWPQQVPLDGAPVVVLNYFSARRGATLNITLQTSAAATPMPLALFFAPRQPAGLNLI